MSWPFPVATICGSMRYYPDMIRCAEQLTCQGIIVIMPFVAIDPANQRNNPSKEMLDEMHRAKIDMAASIVVVGPYKGPSTMAEIEYAKSTGKWVMYWGNTVVVDAESLSLPMRVPNTRRNQLENGDAG
jgi:hypothetical protein